MFVLFFFGLGVGSNDSFFCPRIFIFIFGFEFKFCLFSGFGVGNNVVGLGLLYFLNLGLAAVRLYLVSFFIHVFKNKLLT
jgi:hypothetical protein